MVADECVYFLGGGGLCSENSCQGPWHCRNQNRVPYRLHDCKLWKHVFEWQCHVDAHAYDPWPAYQSPPHIVQGKFGKKYADLDKIRTVWAFIPLKSKFSQLSNGMKAHSVNIGENLLAAEVWSKT